jgi:putative transposase
MSERHACRLLGLGRSTHRCRAHREERDAGLRARLKELAAKRMRFGHRRLTAMLVREGITAKHKRVYRLYRQEGLAMRIRQRRRMRWVSAVSSAAATRANQRWSIDFVSDCVSTGRVIRMLTVVDDCTRECPAIEVDTSLGGLRVRRCWIGSPANAGCEKRSCSITAWSFAGERWRRGAKSAACVWNLFSRASRHEMLLPRVSTADCETNAECQLVHEFERCTAKDRRLAARLQPTTST